MVRGWRWDEVVLLRTEMSVLVTHVCSGGGERWEGDEGRGGERWWW